MRLLTSGLPLPFGDDMVVLKAAIDVPWKDLLIQWLTPFSPAWYIPSTDAFLTTRIVQTLVLKIIFSFSGYNAEAYHWLKDLGYAGVGLGVYAIVFKMTRSVFVSVCSALLFFSSPFVYQSVSWTADFEIINQALVIASALCFFKGYTGKKPLFWFVLTILSAWLAFKTRESSKILPFVMLTFLVWERLFPLSQINEKINRVLAWCSALILGILIIPLGGGPVTLSDSHADGTLRVWDLFLSNKHVQHLFSNPVFAILAISGCVVVVTIIAWFVIRALFKNREGHIFYRLQEILSGGGDAENNISRAYLRFVWIWFAGIFCSVLIFQTYFKFRYLTSLWVPGSMLFGALMYAWIRSNQIWFRTLGWVACLSGFLAVSGIGFYYSVYLRNHMSLKDSSAFNIAQLVYQNRFGAQNPDQKALMDYYLGNPPAAAAEFDGMRVNEWDVIYNKGLSSRDHEIEIKKRLLTKFDQWKKVYLATTVERGFEIPSGGKFVGQVPGDNNSVYSIIMKRLGYSFPVYRVYVWDERPRS